jgi:YHS domain-containing protein
MQRNTSLLIVLGGLLALPALVPMGSSKSCPSGFCTLVYAQGGPNQPDMQTIHKLFADNKKLTRTVKNIPGGIEALTEASDPATVALLQEHVAAMKVRLENKQPMRMWDPLFAVLFQNAEKVKMTVENTKTGVKITETSSDAYVVKLLQEHAKAVSGFVKDGMAGMHVSHPAPPKGKTAVPSAKTKESAFVGKGDGKTTCPVTGEPVDAAQLVTWKGKTVKFCCVSCVAAFKKAPEKFLKK